MRYIVLALVLCFALPAAAKKPAKFNVKHSKVKHQKPKKVKPHPHGH